VIEQFTREDFRIIGDSLLLEFERLLELSKSLRPISDKDIWEIIESKMRRVSLLIEKTKELEEESD
jgi:hypothetical protein